MGDSSISRLARARIIPPDPPILFPSPPELVRSILSPGQRHLAKTRIWRIGGVRLRGDHLLARLGYESEEESDLYDPRMKDFKHEAIVRGRTVTFIVRLADLAVVFEQRRAGMTERDFTSGLRIILRAFDGHRKWTVAPVDTKTTFDEWVHGVDQVNRFRFKVEARDLPDDDASALGGLLRRRPGTLTVDYRCEDGVDVDDKALRELVALARSGSGDVLAVGRKNTLEPGGVQKVWESARSAERVVEQVPVEVEDSDEANTTRLMAVLMSVPVAPSW
jgi:hypothetical protein